MRHKADEMHAFQILKTLLYFKSSDAFDQCEVSEEVSNSVQRVKSTPLAVEFKVSLIRFFHTPTESSQTHELHSIGIGNMSALKQ